MASTFMLFVSIISLATLVCAEVGENSKEKADSKTTAKRGVGGLTGIPGVLYSQYTPRVHTVPVPQPFPVPVPHPVPVQVPRPFPVTVHKPVGLPVPVGVPVPVHVPVPKPYPVPVPVNLPHGTSGFGAFGGSYFGAHQQDYTGSFSHPPLGLSEAGHAGKFGYGLGVYANPGTPSLPLAHSGLAAALSSLAASHLTHPLGHTGLSGPPLDSLGPHPSKY